MFAPQHITLRRKQSSISGPFYVKEIHTTLQPKEVKKELTYVPKIARLYY